jgi:hypothetical protein
MTGSQPSPLDNWISTLSSWWLDLQQQYIYKQKIKKKPAQIRIHKKTYDNNEWQHNMNSTMQGQWMFVVTWLLARKVESVS